LAESESASLATLPDFTSVVNTPTGQKLSSIFFCFLPLFCFFGAKSISMKLTTINRIAFTLLVSAFLFSCKKESSDEATPSYYVKFKMEGNWVTWQKVVGELGPDLADNSKINFGLTANNNTQTEVLDISLQLDGNTINPGTYNSDDHFLPVMYMKNANTANMEGYTLGSIDGQADSRYELTLTSITDKTIKGTFKGNHLVSIMADDEMVHITEGEFVIPRIR
jgi:hypothetical protein